ncbi:DUF3047 domain-containing protein [Paucibacter sp. B2R-40]|nr:DUF3047 domain-containing protein [Paucibacter sp. B2R-40]
MHHRCVLSLGLLGLLLGCANPELPTATAQEPMSAALADWSARELPGKLSTQYSMAHRDGQACVLAKASKSVSLWRRPLKIDPEQIAGLQFDWWIQTLDLRASVLDPDTDDAPARLLLGFDGDESRLSMRNRMQFELVQTLTGEAPPFATLMYVWDANAAAETMLISSRSDRIRKIVVGSGEGGRGRWQRLRRDVRADYIKAFGEAPGKLSSMALMTDGDNTGSRAEACYGSILLLGADQQALQGSLKF